MSEISSWAISKQYLAAHYYLSEERPISISEAQRAQLGALHLHVSFGSYDPATNVPDLQNCTSFERKKRVSEWQKLGGISRITAMKKFIDLISSLFPSWYRFRKLYNEFETEWQHMPDASSPKRNDKPRVESERKKPEKKGSLAFRVSTPTAFKKIFIMKRDKQTVSRARAVQRAETPKIMLSREVSKTPEIAQLPKIAKSIRQYQEKNQEFLKEFLEDLQSHRGGNLKNSSATRLPKGMQQPEVVNVRYKIPEISFDKQMVDYRKSLLSQEYERLYKKPGVVQQKQIIPNLIEKITSMKEALIQIEDEYNRL